MAEAGKPKISVIMVDGSHRQHFLGVDTFAGQAFHPEEYELVWVEFYATVSPELAEKIRQNRLFSVLTLNRTGTYHSSYCFNAGIEAARGDLLVIIDADVLVEPDFLETVWKEHQLNEKLVMYVFRYDEPKKARQGPREMTLQHLRSACVLSNPSNFGGCLTVRKKWLYSINGYEQHPVLGTHYHANGLDVYTRLKNLGLHIMWHPTLRLYHPWHPHLPGYQEAYKMQRVLIRYRALERDILAYQGIDACRNRSLPPRLEAELEGARKKARYSIRRLLRSIARRVR